MGHYKIKRIPRKWAIGFHSKTPSLIIKITKNTKKAAQVGFDWPDKNGPLEKLTEECNELIQAINNNNKQNIDEEIGDILFSIVNICRKNNKSPEELLQKSNNKFIQRFKCLEKIIKSHNKTINECSLNELNIYWDQSKKTQ